MVVTGSCSISRKGTRATRAAAYQRGGGAGPELCRLRLSAKNSARPNLGLLGHKPSPVSLFQRKHGTNILAILPGAARARRREWTRRIEALPPSKDDQAEAGACWLPDLSAPHKLCGPSSTSFNRA